MKELLIQKTMTIEVRSELTEAASARRRNSRRVYAKGKYYCKLDYLLFTRLKRAMALQAIEG